MQVDAAHVAVAVIVMVMIVTMGVSTVVVANVIARPQQEDTRAIHQKADDRDENRLVIVDNDRRHEALRRLVQHGEGHTREQHGASKAAQGIHFSGAKRVARIIGMPPCVGIREQRNA